MLQNITLRVYAHLIAPLKKDDPITGQHFQAIDIADKTAHMIAEIYKGFADCSSCGTVQYSDRVVIKQISEKSLDLILTTFPFVKKSSY